MNMPELCPDCHFEPDLINRGRAGPERGLQGRSHPERMHKRGRKKIIKAWTDPCPAEITRIKRQKTRTIEYTSGKPNPENEDTFYWLIQRRSMTSRCFINISHPRQKHLANLIFEGISDFPRAQKSAPGG